MMNNTFVIHISLLLLAIGVIASPLSIGINALVTRPQNLTANEICFLFEYGTVYGEPGWFRFSIMSIQGERQTLLRYDKSDAFQEVFVNHVDRELLVINGYDQDKDYCSTERTASFFRLAKKSLEGTLRMRSGPGCRSSRKKEPIEQLFELFCYKNVY
ncbi:unnamed protein product [Wickerhamomyces anomalus]